MKEKSVTKNAIKNVYITINAILMKMLFKNCFKDHLQTNGKMITNCMNSEFYIKRY